MGSQLPIFMDLLQLQLQLQLTCIFLYVLLKKKLGPSSKMSCGPIYGRHPQEQNFVLKNPHELGESIILLNKEKTFSFSNNHSISLAFPFFLKYCCNCMIYKYKTVVAILSESEIALYL